MTCLKRSYWTGILYYSFFCFVGCMKEQEIFFYVVFSFTRSIDLSVYLRDYFVTPKPSKFKKIKQTQNNKKTQTNRKTKP